MSSLQPQELYKILDQVQYPTAVSQYLEGVREITAVLDTNTISRKTTNTKEKKKNNNTVREKQVQNTLTVKSTCQHATVNSTNTEHKHDIDSANLRKADRFIGERKRQETEKYYLPEFLHENLKTIIHKRSTMFNNVDSSSEDEDLPHKRFSRK